MKTFFPLLLIFILTPGECLPQERNKQIGERFGGEEIQYEVGFWVFPAVGRGLAHFYDLGNAKFLLTHEGQAQGLAGWITSYRKEVHRAWMGAIDQGRFIPLRLEEESIIGDWVRKKTTLYDYSAGKIFMETKKEEEINRETVEIPQGVVYENPITAFYNFRFGFYGKVEPGREFTIRTVPGKGQGIFRITVATEKEATLRRESDPQKKGKDLLVQIHLEQEFLGSPRGEIEAWFDKDLNPVSGMIKKVRFFGDIKGRITHLGHRSPGQAPKSF
jgi:hypothetical protein